MVALLPGAILLGGCGGGSDFKNDPRPPTPIQLTGVITDSSVTISPNKLGAGPVILIISNQAHQAHTITLQSGGPQDRGVRSSPSPCGAPTASSPDITCVGPINPLDTAKLQQTLKPGQYTVSAGSTKAVPKEVKAATISVGTRRSSSSNTLLLP